MNKLCRQLNRLGMPCIAMLLIGIVVVTSIGCGESAQWKYAQAINDYDSGDLDSAIENMKQAIASTDDRSMKLVLATIYYENGQGDLGLAICDELLESQPGSADTLYTRAICLQHLGRFKESLRDYQESLSGIGALGTDELNNLAYFRGLAGVDLTEAAYQIQKAIDTKEKEEWGSQFRAVSLRVRAAVAIGLISRHLDQQELAVGVLDKMIERIEPEWQNQLSLINQLVAANMALSFPLDQDKQESITNNFRGLFERSSQSLGLLLVARCLVNEDLKNFDQVDCDRRLIAEMGLDFEELINALPSDDDCLFDRPSNFSESIFSPGKPIASPINLAAVYLDTRGFVMARQPWHSDDVVQWRRFLKMDSGNLLCTYEEALIDLDLAVAAGELKHAAAFSPLANRNSVPIKSVRHSRKTSGHDLAVLRYHRMQAHMKAGNTKAAEIDRDRVESLGFKADDSLH